MTLWGCVITPPATFVRQRKAMWPRKRQDTASPPPFRLATWAGICGVLNQERSY